MCEGLGQVEGVVVTQDSQDRTGLAIRGMKRSSYTR